MKSKEQKKNFW